MNPFVNPNKRSIQLPDGCKDLMDMLKNPEPKRECFPSKHHPEGSGFALWIVDQADSKQATELIIGIAPPVGGTPLKFKIAGAWHDQRPFPTQVRSGVIAHFAREANCPEGQFPIEAILTIFYKEFATNKDGQSSWRVMVPSAEAECILVRIKNQDATAATAAN